VEHSISEEIEW